MAHNILVVDDEAGIRDMVKDIITYQGHNCFTASDGNSALKIMKEKRPSIVILDIWLEGSELDGIGVLEFIMNHYPSTKVIIISGHGTIKMAVDSIHMGAYEYLEKPIEMEKLTVTVKRAIESYILNLENSELKKRVRNTIIGSSQIINNLKTNIEKIASTSSRVLVHGEPGTGKEMVARMIHTKSKRSANNLVFFRPQNYDPTKMLIELFGEQSGEMVASKKIPAIERAHNGTLVIDEIAALSEKAQSDLLKFLQSGKITRDGGREISADIRIISITRYNIENLIASGKFNGDLYYRLSVNKINTPSVREFKEDIPALCEHFTRQLMEMGLPYKKLSEEVITQLQLMDWPLNVRQLKNYFENLYLDAHSRSERMINKMFILNNDNNKDKDMKGSWFEADSVMRMPLREARETFERYYLTAQIQRFSGNISKTSTFVGMERSALHRKLKSLNVIGPGQSDEKDFEENTAEAI